MCHKLIRAARLLAATTTVLATTVLTTGVSIVALAGVPAFAATAGTPLAAADLQGVINNLIVWIGGILAAVATLYLTIGGVRYLTAGGDPTEVDKAKSAFKSAGIGYALAFLAPVLLTML